MYKNINKFHFITKVRL